MNYQARTEEIPIIRPYVKRGTKTAAREAARKAGLKSFLFTCHKHGLTVFGTAGQGTCRACVADHKRAAYERQKREEMTAATAPENEQR
ncbi:hypothetical protein [Burkholderia sp. Ac-20353]|uniref:hypothetical protein n=1 Tax=Burkholderia sp. Ac-20353 TaxID=2703894 RepID=UPI00197C9232|nr:hypothetical protein [Burkholderia sp. Ac-20353]MBN3791869.1 hypothetical protein [Burkholderia sp. Ac-20353]